MRLIGLAVIFTLSLILAPVADGAQQAGRTATIGYLGNSSPTLESNLVQAFREGLRRLGYVEGQNLVIKYVWAEGQQERYAVLARELVSLKPDVILAAGTPGTLAAQASDPVNPHRHSASRGTRGGWPRIKPREAGRERDRTVHACAGIGGEAARTLQGGGPEVVAGCRVAQSGQSVHNDCLEGHTARGGGAGREAAAGRDAEPQ